MILRKCATRHAATECWLIYYVDSSRLLPTGPAPMMRWRKRLFSFMARNASAATDFFKIPPHRVLELGARIEF